MQAMGNGGGGQGTEVSHKAPIKIGESQKVLQLTSSGRSETFSNCLDLLLIHLNGSSRDDMPQEGCSGAEEFTFLYFNVQLILKEALKDMLDTVRKEARTNKN